ncbi:LemA family protein [Marinococcus halotolerans]|uniref:LemA family protein n=1 Tax=Marinococcus halotolerans TaxID=301092 RepID=UPI0003B54655|nr:LemA family protein [Marinococcus halotolerans]
MSIFGIILGIVIVTAIISWIIGYNALIKYLNWVEESWTEVEFQLHRRMNLIPDFVDSAQKAWRHKQDELETLVQYRSEVLSPESSRQEQLHINSRIEENLHEVFDASMPEDKQLQSELKSMREQFDDAQNKIIHSSSVYNNTIDKYNAKISSFPVRFVAELHHFKTRSPLPGQSPAPGSKAETKAETSV